ncbi:MAG TPA: hypothetical protein VND93_32990 [Myxococcales bacterium]|nr:hypothetical protein [Myxococcales bacterium]
MSYGIRLAILAVVLMAPGAAHGLSKEKARERDEEQQEQKQDREDEDGDEEEAAREEAPREEPPKAQGACTGAGEEVDAEAAASMRVAVSGKERPISSVRLHGLKTLTEERVWQVVGERPSGQISAEQASALVARLIASGLFSAVTPTLDVVGDAAVLDVTLAEHPVVSRIVIEGLTEVRAEEVLEAILDGAPKEKRSRAAKSPCGPPLPPRGWLAHRSDGAVAPGIVWQGLRGALDRALRKLIERGYAMASLDGELATDGTLTLHVDEGHLESLELQGVEPSVEPEARKLLGFKAGDVFLLDDLKQGVRRVHRNLPFLEPAHDGGDRERPAPQVAEERLEGGRLKYRTVEGGSRKASRHLPGNLEVHGRTLSWSLDEDHSGSVQLPFDFSLDEPSYVAIQGRRATVRFRRSLTEVDFSWEELAHHTQVQGPAPGLLLSVTLLDPENRGHLTLDGGVWLNTALSQPRLDYLVGARLRVPWLRVAEVGAQRYSLTDTSDGWRATPLSSYLGSGLFNRPDREYFRRDGFTGLLTLHLGESLTLGAEYRNDAERSMQSATVSQSLLNRGELPWDNPPIDEGRLASVVGRVEWSSAPVLLREVGRPLRSLERTLSRADVKDDATGWQSVNTVEVADERLGGDFHFTRLVSDSWVHLHTGGMLRGRLRVAGGVGVLPAQKMEALGGWTALRGYDFKELRGDASVLATAEYQWAVFSAFVDVGSVRSAGVWSPAKVGLGAAFNLGDFAVAAAWRTDDRARLVPEARLVFQRTY